MQRLKNPRYLDQEMTSYSGEMRQEGCVIETKNARRNRVRVRRMKYTCRTKSSTHGDNTGGDEDVGSSTKILSVSFSTGENDSAWSSYGAEESPRKTRGAYGVVSVKGGRKAMEDAVRAELGLGVNRKFDFFGVYDGHGGADVAKACRERMHDVVAETVEMEGVKIDGDNKVDWERVMDGCFGKMDAEVSGVAGCRTMGATAVVAVVTEEEVVVGNCGDCRAVLSRGGVAVALSNDHKPDREDELKRIEDAGGKVIDWNGNRVLGVLATSRSIGDQYMRPYVISKPEATVTKRTDGDEFLILASDGLWDVISNDVACRVVNKCLDGRMTRRRISPYEHDDHKSTTMYDAAAALADLAMARGSTDNISVIVVNLSRSTN